MVLKPSRRADDVVFHSLLRKKNSIFYVNLALTYVKGPLTEQYWFWLKPIGIVYYCGISEPAPVQSVIDQLLPRRRHFLIPDIFRRKLQKTFISAWNLQIVSSYPRISGYYACIVKCTLSRFSFQGWKALFIFCFQGYGLDSSAVSLFGNMTVDTEEILISTKEYQNKRFQ